MRIVAADPADRNTTQACFEVVRAADEADDPQAPPWSLRRFQGWLEHPREPAEMWAVGDGAAGAGAGWYYLILPDRENLGLAYLFLTVHPAARRRGIGTALLRHAAGRAARAGRAVLGSGALQGSPGAAFATRAGATPGLVDARRVQVLSDIPAGRIASLREQAARASGGYSLLSWDGRIPDDYLDRYAAVQNAMADAPTTTASSPGSGTPTGSARPRTSASSRASVSTRSRPGTTRAGSWPGSPRWSSTWTTRGGGTSS